MILKKNIKVGSVSRSWAGSIEYKTDPQPCLNVLLFNYLKGRLHTLLLCLGLAEETTEKDLKKTFSEFGTIIDCKVSAHFQFIMFNITKLQTNRKLETRQMYAIQATYRRVRRKVGYRKTT